VVRSCFPNCFLLCAAVFAQGPVARSEFAPDALNIFFHDRKFGVGGDQFLFGKT